MKTRTTTLLAVILLANATHAQGPVAAGGQFQVNSYTPNRQGDLSIAGLPDGGFVAAWASLGSAGSDNGAFSIQARRFDASGIPLGEDFQVNTYTRGSETHPSLAVLDDDRFVVVWTVHAIVHSSVQGRFYTADATPLGDQFLIGSYTPSSHFQPDVSALEDGGFVTVWRSSPSDSDPSGASIQGQLFDAGGMPAGGQFQVNTYVTGSQTYPQVAAIDDGGFVVVWQSVGSGGSDTDRNSIQGRRYAADGLPLSDDFQVNTMTIGNQYRPSVAAVKDSGFIVAWHGAGPTGSDIDQSSIQAQLYDLESSAQGEQFQLNSMTSRNQLVPAVAPWGDGFVASWYSARSSGSDTSGWSIQLRHFTADGTPLGGDIQVNSHIDDDQWVPKVAPLADDGFVVGWTSQSSAGSDTSDWSIQGQRFADPRFALSASAGGCLTADSPEPTGFRRVLHVACDGSEAQRWRLNLTRSAQQIRGPGGDCLTLGPASNTGEPSVVLTECSEDDFWQLESPEHAKPSAVIHLEFGLCLLAGEVGNPARMGACRGNVDRVWRPSALTCTPDSIGLCLADERYRVDVAWRAFDGTVGSSQVVPRVSSADSGLLWFFEANNWEMLIKVLDGCAINDRFWVFSAATTNVEYTLTVTDTATGQVREYFNPLGQAAPAITDTSAFATCSADATRSSEPPVRSLRPVDSGVDTSSVGACVPSATRMCLTADFAVEVTWADGTGGTGPGQVVESGSDAAGLFWFFDQNNWEMLVKVLDGCDINDRYWLLAAATTDVEYTLRVTDMDSGVFREYFNPSGRASPAVIDTFATCP